jgi:hypothetical protein
MADLTVVLEMFGPALYALFIISCRVLQFLTSNSNFFFYFAENFFSAEAGSFALHPIIATVVKAKRKGPETRDQPARHCRDFTVNLEWRMTIRTSVGCPKLCDTSAIRHRYHHQRPQPKLLTGLAGGGSQAPGHWTPAFAQSPIRAQSRRPTWYPHSVFGYSQLLW